MPRHIRIYLKKIIFLITFAFPAHKSIANNDHDSLDKTIKINRHNPDNNRLSKKYAELLNMEETQVNKFLNLYTFIDNWMGTKYKWGGCSTSGIDCSCFIMKLFDEVFDIKIQRTTFTQFYDKDVALFRNRSQFQLGDLVFFKTNIARETRNNRITHVGMYLANGFFVQSSSAGVNIANLNAGYWKNCFVAAGRLNEKFYKNSRLSMPLGEVQETKQIKAEELENSDFEPVPYPEDLDDLKLKYAELLQVDIDKINFPEIFNYIDKNRYAPFNISKNCAAKENKQSCFLRNFYKEALNLDLNCELNEIISLKYTAEVKNKAKASALDFILIPMNGKLNSSSIIGLYLYNNYFLHIQDNEVVIASIKDSLYEDKTYSLFRIDQEILQRGYNYVIETRRNNSGKTNTDSTTNPKDVKTSPSPGSSTTPVKEQNVNPANAATTPLTGNTAAAKIEKENTAEVKIMEGDPVARQKALEEKRALEREQIRKEVLEKLERERMEEEKAAAEKAAKKREAEIRAEVERIERKRIADELAENKRMEQERMAIEAAERKRIADEKAAAAKAEQKRIAMELAEKQRLEYERLTIENAERKRIADEKAATAKAEQKRIAMELAEKQRLEYERMTIEAAERKKMADEKAAAIKAEQKRMAAELAEKKRLELERIAIEAAERKRIADEKAAAAKAEQKRIAEELAEKKRLEQERLAIEAAERKKIADEKAAAVKAEQKRIADELAEKKRLEKERIEFEIAEQKRIAAEKAEAERLERLRIAAEKAEAARIERKRLLDEQARKDSIVKRAKLDEQFEKRRQEALAADAQWKEKIKKEQEAEQERIRLEQERIKAEKIKIEQEAALMKQQEAAKKKSEKEKKKKGKDNTDE